MLSFILFANQKTRNRRKSGKVEKADVLELAVQYIKEIKQEKSVQKELAFEAGYILCQQNVENYLAKIKEQSKKSTEATKSDCSNEQCKQRAYLMQKDLIKTLDQQWTDYVQNTNYNRKMDEQRLMQFDNQEKSTQEITSANDLNKLTIKQQALDEKDSSTGKFFFQPENLSSNTISMNDKIIDSDLEKLRPMMINPLTLQNSSKFESFISPTSTTSATTNSISSFRWKDKFLKKADELMAIKMYNELVMHNLNRNKSLCSSASSTSSCSSYAKTLSSLTNHLANHHLTNGQGSNHSNGTNMQSTGMSIDLDSKTSNYPSSSTSSCYSVNSLSSLQSNSNKEQDKVPSIMSKYSHSNSPFKKRKKIYQFAFNASLNENLWRPW